MAPAPGEPSPGEGLRLVTRDDEGTEDRTEVALDELVGEGAALVIAGLDGATSARALRWGSNHGVAVVALVPPEAGEGNGPFGFVLGAARKDVADALLRAAPTLLTDPVVPLVDASEWTPPAPGAVPPPSRPNLLAPVSCDTPVVRAGDPRFPFASWQADKVRGWVVSGSPSCASDLLGEMSSRSAAVALGLVGAAASSSHGHTTVALTLEAASRPPHPSAVRVVTASAGLVPSRISAVGDDEVHRFGGLLGDDSLTYWASLGRDAGTIARVTLRKLANVVVTEPRAVAARRAEAKEALLAAKVPLWSTEGVSWVDVPGGGHAIKRTLCALDVPGGRTPDGSGRTTTGR
jgi:hypothetical protein